MMLLLVVLRRGRKSGDGHRILTATHHPAAVVDAVARRLVKEAGRRSGHEAGHRHRRRSIKQVNILYLANQSWARNNIAATT